MCDLAPIPIKQRLRSLDRAPDPTPFDTLLVVTGACLASRIHGNANLGNIMMHDLKLDADVVISWMWPSDIDKPRSSGR